jgi:hypothetical protein
MKANRQVVQYIEGCSKEGLSYLNNSVNSKPIGTCVQTVPSAVAVKSNEFTNLRHGDSFSDQSNIHGISIDSPYKNLYIKLKSLQTPNSDYLAKNQRVEVYNGREEKSLEEDVTVQNISTAVDLTPKVHQVAPSFNRIFSPKNAYGNKSERHTAIYKRYLENPRFMEVREHQEFHRINRMQETTMLLTLTGVFIPMWAMTLPRKYRVKNTKIWGAVCVTHLGLIGLNSLFSSKFRSYLNDMDSKYFSKLNLAQIENA